MLSRVERNAYSWWWASHIRTKQSKWLDQNIQDMEEKVEYILRIITEDGDSFRVRAEQYYRKRPELVNFVEDTFRGYRALAERYDHLSKDLQSANRTIAMIFPERVQMSIDDEEYEDFTSNVDEYENMVTTNSHVPAPFPFPPKQNKLPKMESVVQAMLKKNSKMPTMMMSKKGLVKIGVDESVSCVPKSSGLSKDEAIDEIDKLQKEILGLQTEKEFVKSSYESVLSKYWEIENIISEMHSKVSNLQHEFAVGEAMDDKDAQILMTSSALKMCKDMLDKFTCRQNWFKTKLAVEHHRIDDIKKMFEALIARNKDNKDLNNLEQTSALVPHEHAHDPNMEKLKGNDQKQVNQKESENIKEKEAKTKEEIIGITEVMTISEVAAKIEQLVDKVINFDTDFSSQTALIMRLRFVIDELHEKLQCIEQETNSLIDGSNNNNMKVKKLEEQLERVHLLDKRIKLQNKQLETCFDEASVSLDNLSKGILIAKPDEETDEDDMIFEKEKKKTTQKVSKLEEKEKENIRKDNDDLEGFVKRPNEKLDEGESVTYTESLEVIKDQDVDCIREENEPKWNLIFSHETEDKDKMLMEEYTSTLKSFKEVKQKLNETEKRNRARSFKYAVEIKMLRKANDRKDAELRSLNEKLKLLETNIHKHELDDIDITTTLNAIDENTQRTEEQKQAKNLIKIGKDLVHEGSHTSKQPDEFEGTQISKELDTNIEVTKASNSVDDLTHHELQETRIAKLRSITDIGNEGHGILEIEEEIRADIEDLRKENLEVWLRFSTSYHQINRFQDSFHDLIQEIKQLKDRKHEQGSDYKPRLNHRRHSSSIASDIRPLYRHLSDMQTEVVLWLEKTGILEDDLQHRLASLSDIQKELSDLTKDVLESETMNVQHNTYEAAKFQGEVLNMKEENAKVLDELREASERVRMLHFDIEKTLSKLDEELGQKNKSNTSSRVPFKSILFRSKLKKKHKHSLFTCMSPSLQRQYSELQELPKPK